MPLRVGVLLPFHAALPGSALGDVGKLASHAEDLGLDGVWVGDHLVTGHALLESTVAMTAAAVSTTRIRIGSSVLIPALRPTVLAAKQIASLQYASGSRLGLGVGVGPGNGNPDEWAAAGVSARDRGRRTDHFLEVLPGLLGGRPTMVETGSGSSSVTLEPAVPLPEIWIGGTSHAAMERTIKHGDGWLTAMLNPSEIGAGSSRLIEQAHSRGRPAPAVGTAIFVTMTSARVGNPVAEVTAFLAGPYQLGRDRAEKLAVGGTPQQVAERLMEYVNVGVTEFVVIPFGSGMRRQYELLAEARRLLAEQIS